MACMAGRLVSHGRGAPPRRPRGVYHLTLSHLAVKALDAKRVGAPHDADLVARPPLVLHELSQRPPVERLALGVLLRGIVLLHELLAQRSRRLVLLLVLSLLVRLLAAAAGRARHAARTAACGARAPRGGAAGAEVRAAARRADRGCVHGQRRVGGRAPPRSTARAFARRDLPCGQGKSESESDPRRVAHQRASGVVCVGR